MWSLALHFWNNKFTDRLSIITLLCWGPPRIYHGAKLCTTNVTMPNSRYRMMNCSWMGKWFQSICRVPIHFCSCGFRSVWWRHATEPLISWWRQCRSPQRCGTGVYLLLSQVSQPGTEHLKEALTLFWLGLTWFMWAGCGFVSLLWHSVFHVRLFMRIWRWVLRAHGCSLK